MAGSNVMAATSLAPKVLCATQLSGTTATAVYTVPAGGSAKITFGSICNTSGSTVTVSLSLVTSGGTAGVGNRVISGASLLAGDTLPLASFVAGATLGPGEFVSVTAGTAAALTVVLTGTEHS